jgi:myosin-1
VQIAGWHRCLIRAQTSQALYIAITQIANGRPTTTLERKIPLMTIRSVGMSNLRDDWIAVNVASQEEDPVLTCLLKTELVTHLVQQSNGSVSVNISSQSVLLRLVSTHSDIQRRVEYTKKKDKKAVIKFVKDESVQRNDVYKSHTVSVASGDPPTSKSMPPAPRKPGVAKPIASGKLLKAGGPANGPTRKPQARTLPGASTTPRPAPMAASAQMPRPAPTMPQAPAGMPRAPAAPVGLAAVIPKAPGLVASVKAAPPPQAQAAPKSQPAKAPPPPPPSRKPVAAAKVQYKWFAVSFPDSL